MQIARIPELSGAGQQELRNAAKGDAAQSLTWRGPYSAGRPGTQVIGVFMDP